MDKSFDYLVGDIYTGEMVRIYEFGTLTGAMWKAWVYSPRKREWIEICSKSVPSSDGSVNFLNRARKAYAEEVAAGMPRLREQYPWAY